MKVRHWAGYGTVEAKVIRHEPLRTTIEVYGNHEQGLEPRYFTTKDWYRWLGKRFKIKDDIYQVACYPTEWSDKDNMDHMRVVFIQRGEW